MSWPTKGSQGASQGESPLWAGLGGVGNTHVDAVVLGDSRVMKSAWVVGVNFPEAALRVAMGVWFTPDVSHPGNIDGSLGCQDTPLGRLKNNLYKWGEAEVYGIPPVEEFLQALARDMVMEGYGRLWAEGKAREDPGTLILEAAKHVGISEWLLMQSGYGMAAPLAPPHRVCGQFLHELPKKRRGKSGGRHRKVRGRVEARGNDHEVIQPE